MHRLYVAPAKPNTARSSSVSAPADILKDVSGAVGRPGERAAVEDAAHRKVVMAPPAKQAIAVAAPPAPRDAYRVASATLPSHPEPDVCARSGGDRVDFMRGHHGMWRCVYPRPRSER